LDGENEWHCPKCHKFTQAKMANQITRLPKVFMICLKRFQQGNRNFSKLNHLVDFPLQLDMGKHSPGGRVYELWAVINHFGGLQNGHYKATSRDLAGRWHEYNDEQVTSLSPESLVSRSAYVLFYRSS
jgi:ubiquitin C-terminal hydrolase